MSIDVHSVTLNPNGGTLVGSSTLSNQLVMPDLSGYVPTRSGGYVFEGWYLENGDPAPAAGSDLTEDVVLTARWKEPLDISGEIYVATQYNSGANTIHEADRLKEMDVTLYRKTPNSNIGVEYDSVTDVKINYSGSLGVVSYVFDDLPNDGSTYYISVSVTNFSTKFWNENLSAGNADDVTKYSDAEGSNIAVDQSPANNIANVHAYLEFKPVNFDLDYKVDATAISPNFRPAKASVLVQYDNSPAD